MRELVSDIDERLSIFHEPIAASNFIPLHPFAFGTVAPTLIFPNHSFYYCISSIFSLLVRSWNPLLRITKSLDLNASTIPMIRPFLPEALKHTNLSVSTKPTAHPLKAILPSYHHYTYLYCYRLSRTFCPPYQSSSSSGTFSVVPLCA